MGSGDARGAAAAAATAAATTAAEIASSQPPDPSKVRFLAFEGGGGKGLAFLGAINVLDKELSVLAHVEGFAGASAGAITALLMALGHDADSAKDFIDKTDFNAFWDEPSDSRIPLPGSKYGERKRSSDEWQTENVLLVTLTPKIVGVLAGFFVGDDAKKPPFSVLIKHFARKIANLDRDMGLFSGEKARDAFHEAIRDAYKGGTKYAQKGKEVGIGSEWPSDRFMTFGEHQKIFGKRLVLTSTNLATGKTEVFSATATPNFPVADAVRMSMGLPFIFNPYVLENSFDGGRPPCGTYVDGGLWNNAPFREFEGESGLGPDAVANTLLLRVEVDPEDKVRSLSNLLKVTGNHALFGTGESQVNRRYMGHSVILDSFGLSLVEFKPHPDVMRAVTSRAERAVRSYFRMKGRPSLSKVEADDQRLSDQRRQDAKNACGPSPVVTGRKPWRNVQTLQPNDFRPNR